MLPGVYTAKKKNGSQYFRASVTYRSKHISLGSFDLEPDAHQAYQESLMLLNTQNITLDDILTTSAMLSFEKRVSLINFRDHHIYFKNPIYLKNKYFLYFISPTDELKFDIDDLFYYSNHKIMRRQGHLFVSDYGMQVNILSRYGIKNHAVCGRDYQFVNSDESDFRYSNIININKYYGVSQTIKKNRLYYKTKIHLTGTFTVGTYESEEVAAIAFNKAADLAKKNGIQKNFMTNYIPDYSPREYAETYTKAEISQNYLDYLNKRRTQTTSSS